MGVEIKKVMLSGSTDGKQIELTAVATPGDIIHTADATADVIDELWLFVDNESATNTDLTLEWGGVTDITNTMKFVIPGNQELKAIIPGLPIQNGQVVRAFAGAANELKISGYVNRLTQS